MYVLRIKAMMPDKKITFFYIVNLKIRHFLQNQVSYLQGNPIYTCVYSICIWVHENLSIYTRSHLYTIEFIGSLL